MRLPRSLAAASVCIQFALFVALLLHAKPVACQEPPFALDFGLAPDVRTRLLEAERDSTLAPWQRQFMLDVAEGRPSCDATDPPISSPGVSAATAESFEDDGSWIKIAPPPARDGHTAIYDALRDRIVLFGGKDDFGYLNDVWVLSLSGSPAWSALIPAGNPPPARYLHSAIFDPVRDRMVVFGGYGGNYLSDVWALSLSNSPTWNTLATTGSEPSARRWHTAIYDPVRDRMVVFGGQGGPFASDFLNDLWALSLSGSPAWGVLAPVGNAPSKRGGHTAIYDPVRDQMLVFGGLSATTQNDLWALPLSGAPAWGALTVSGSPPPARYSHTAIYEQVGDKMLVFGGNSGATRNDVWALSLSGAPIWGELTPTGIPPSARSGQTANFDPVRERMVIFGGRSSSSGTYWNGTWALTLPGSTSWTALIPEVTPLTERSDHTAVYDPVRDRVVVFGGRYASSYFNDVWALSLSANPTWSVLAPTGSPPAARRGHTAIYDPLRDRVVVFGGVGGSYFNDAWALSLQGSPAWSALTPTGPPPIARRGHSAIYDPVRDRMLVFGGHSGSYFNDVWALLLSGSPAWSALTPSGSLPSARYEHSAIYDPVRDRMVIFGGYGGTFQSDAWDLSLSGSPVWNELAPAGAAPTARLEHAGIYDAVRDRMVVFGGLVGSNLLNDSWALTFSGGPAWSVLAPSGALPSKRAEFPAIYDPARDRMVIIGGLVTGGYQVDAWALGWSSTLAVDHVDSKRIQLGTPRPNPTRGETYLEFELGEPASVVIEVFDVRGRRVKWIANDWFHAGRHVSAWLGDDEDGHVLGSGVYFIRMKTGGFEATRRTVRLR